MNPKPLYIDLQKVGGMLIYLERRERRIEVGEGKRGEQEKEKN